MTGLNEFRKTGIKALSLRLAILGILGVHAPGVHAQEADDAASTATPAAQGGGQNLISEITVTSRRFSESVSDVPISISAYDTKTLDVAGVKDFSGIAQFTPGVSFSSGNNLIAIRGISSSAGAATTGVYIDETPVHIRQFGTGPTAGLPAVFDLERVEVLRGPQGTLYGAGSQGGTVRFITPQPDLNSFSAYGKGEVAFTKTGEPTYETGFAVGGPIVDGTLGFRISAYNRREGGWVDWLDYNTGVERQEDVNSVNTSAYRAALTWEPIEGLSITPSVFHQELKSEGGTTVTEAWSDFGNNVFNYSNHLLPNNSDRFTLPSLKAEYAFGDYLVVSNTAWYERDQLATNDAGIWRLSNLQLNFGFPLLTPFGPDDQVGVSYFNAPGRIINGQENFTQELRIQSDNRDSRLTWVAGVYYSEAKQHNVERGESGRNLYTGQSDYDRLYEQLWGMTVLERHGFPLFEGYISYVTDTWVEEKQQAIFADASWQVTDKLSVSAGIRVSEVEFSFEAGRASNTQADWTYNGGSSDERAVTPRFNITYQVGDDTMMYANAAKGFRGGGANSSSIIDRCSQYIAELGLGDVSQYDSDFVWSYDVGVKGQALQGRVAYDVGVYNIDWTGIQQSNSLVGCGLSYIGNFGDARSRGVDLTVQAAPLDDLLLDVSVGYMNSEFTELVTSSAAPNATVVINEGNSLPNITPWKLALAATYNFDAFGRESFVRAAWEYGSKQDGILPTQDPLTSQYNPAIPFLPANNMVRLRTGMSFDSLDVSLFADNLLDSAPLLSRSSSSRTDYYQVSTWRPRTFGVSVIYRY
jgi:outer membrane receptor protein involved in Fe transport